MARIVQHKAIFLADPPVARVQVLVGTKDAAYIKALARTLNVDDELGHQLRMKIEQILDDKAEVSTSGHVSWWC